MRGLRVRDGTRASRERRSLLPLAVYAVGAAVCVLLILIIWRTVRG